MIKGIDNNHRLHSSFEDEHLHDMIFFRFQMVALMLTRCWVPSTSKTSAFSISVRLVSSFFDMCKHPSSFAFCVLFSEKRIRVLDDQRIELLNECVALEDSIQRKESADRSRAEVVRCSELKIKVARKEEQLTNLRAELDRELRSREDIKSAFVKSFDYCVYQKFPMTDADALKKVQSIVEKTESDNRPIGEEHAKRASLSVYSKFFVSTVLILSNDDSNRFA